MRIYSRLHTVEYSKMLWQNARMHDSQKFRVQDSIYGDLWMPRRTASLAPDAPGSARARRREAAGS